MVRRLTVPFLVDASDSIQRDELSKKAIDYVNAAAKQRNIPRGDKAGAIVFGRVANIDVPPVAQSWHIAPIEAGHNARFSNLEAALQLAEVTLPEDPAKRVVVVSDGNENLGQANPQAAKMRAAGIGIDCVPISYERQGEVTVEEIAAAAGGHQ